MSEASVSKGAASEQDAATPSEFMAAIERRFGPVQFDLAAHAGNRKHARYFAPRDFVEAYDPVKTPRGILVRRLMRAGAHLDEAERAIDALDGKKGKIVVPNHDAEAAGLDSLKFLWAELSDTYRAPGPGQLGDPSHAGLLWLNPEYSAIEPWAKKCALEAARGANIVMLTPASVGANWFRDHVAGRADVSLLNGRITFVGSTAGYPKDLMVSHFHRHAGGGMCIWDWRSGNIYQRWGPCERAGVVGRDAA
jgi:hypothetical protein